MGAASPRRPRMGRRGRAEVRRRCWVLGPLWWIHRLRMWVAAPCQLSAVMEARWREPAESVQGGLEHVFVATLPQAGVHVANHANRRRRGPVRVVQIFAQQRVSATHRARAARGSTCATVRSDLGGGAPARPADPRVPVHALICGDRHRLLVRADRRSRAQGIRPLRALGISLEVARASTGQAERVDARPAWPGSGTPRRSRVRARTRNRDA